MRCIAIDDENLALELIKGYISRIPFLELDSVFTNPFDAMDYLMKNKVDLIFCDIEMNDINGVQLISSLKNRPMVVFISAYDRYAIDGFSLDAIDYLLKPVSFDRFLKAVNKAYENFSLKNHRSRPVVVHTEAGNITPGNEYIFIKSDNRLVKLFFSDILFVEGYGDYVKIHLKDNKVLLSLQNMSSLETKLPTGFTRVHRSFIVSIDKIEEIERKRIKISKHNIPISDTYNETFFSMLNN